MESMLPDAFDASQTGLYTGQTLGAGNMDLESVSGNASAPAPLVKVDDPPKFELESYIANYTGRTRFNRLYLIGTCSTYLSTEALKAAVAEAKSGKDVVRYQHAVLALAEVAPNEPEATMDTKWVDHMQKVVKAETDRLEHELRGYKNNLIKESIRMGNEDLGQHYHQIGNLVAASKAYSRMRDYCTTPSHIASMLFKIINVAIERGDWLSVQSNVHRLRNLQSKPEEQAKNQPKMSAALGLSQLHSGSYLEAANCFLSTDPSLGDSYNEVLTSNDVAVYGGLCALASMDRNELQRRVLDNNAFRNFLELEPHIRRAISFFCNSKFRPCLEILESYKADYLLDIHLQRHVSTIFTRIRTKAIQQYVVPFSRVTLDSMLKVFAPGVAGGHAHPTDFNSPFVQELIGLIQDGTLDARIDLEKGVLVSKQTDLRTEVQRDTLESLSSFRKEAHLRLLRTNILRAGLEVRSPGEERRFKMEERGGKALAGLGGRYSR
ncbi:COP9 signalosome complex subunit 1 [Aspergillus clavatus NRRL 1]|uniref:COP9 signalosome complex subunit 1 n=1 Tax=Aspergillus clavatus (strain ATCC 1007 / CBS 513.65 / DSM 816 / NCTC 3887 / NRRL 1 / QM 1276 / 107) TaxID=344612 RepID=A1C432_ASPCL|nr:COP9 signalosome subunit 1 (CsnA), putative [Aspergillus clavatus NRRL 1]EAW15172.1 COP9 signalosome subunit 1 (CsnA), putative [Aspergillus clavatus NRRL 1]